ncbi:MAG: bifunctional aminoglycoside phosphotransferase/ATP-binding protein [Methylococcaceae bacterium]
MNDTPNSKPFYPPLIHALCNADAYAHEIDSVCVVETHISWVLLTGHYAYKIKKPVNFGFLDFSTLEKRQFCCAEEVRLNQRLAADLYLDVVPITGTPENPKIAGAGLVIEYAVRMLQFPAGQLLGERAEKGLLDEQCCDQIADRVAGFHGITACAGAASPYGDSEVIRHWFVENFDHIKPLLDDDRFLQQLQLIETWGDDEWRRKTALMQSRKQQGYVRECHGDLHLGNMTLIDGKVVLFDCIEFNPQLRWIDVISDIAFLFIDLLRFGYEPCAWRVINHYLQITGDYSGLGVFRYYLVYRALVRGKVALLRMTQQHEAAHKQTCDEYVLLANIAERFTKTAKPLLMITHGYSGSGKSTFAAQLTEKTGAIQLRSDVERKRLFGYQAQDNTGGGIYTKDASERTYQRLAELAKIVIESGFSVIVDATFLKAAQRQLFKELAEASGAAFLMLDFQASEPALFARIEQRQQQHNDASEATAEVLQLQLQWAQPFTSDEESYRLTINTESENVLATLMDQITCRAE